MAGHGYRRLNTNDALDNSGSTALLELPAPRIGDSRTVSINPGTEEKDGRRNTSKDSSGSSNENPDLVRFSSGHFFAHENAGVAVASIIRLGALKDTCQVDFRTVDNSALAGRNYIHTTGSITFFPQEEIKHIEIPLSDNPYYDTNLDFKVVMENNVNCAMSRHGNSCRIAINDDDIFPSNRFRQNVINEDLGGVGLRMLFDFIKFCINRIPLVGRRTYWNLALDQFSNVNYIVAIWLNVYLIDVVLNLHSPEAEERLWVPGQRLSTAALVALAMILPKAFISFFDYLQVGELAVAGKIKLQLKVNLFRKYLYFDSQSYSEVSRQDIMQVLGDDVDTVVSLGFLVIFKLAQQIVKVGGIMYFLCRKRPVSALPLLVYPVVMAAVLNLRYLGSLKRQEDLRTADTKTLACMVSTFDDLHLIKEYNKRDHAVAGFEKCLKDAVPHIRTYLEYDFKTTLASPWITNVAVSLFVIVGAYYVINGHLTLGDFLASIGIYKDAGSIFAGFYTHAKNIYTVIGPFLRVVVLMNKTTDNYIRMAQNEDRFQGMQDQFAEMDEEGQVAGGTAVSRFDMLHIRLVGVSIAHPVLKNISLSIPQGKFVAVIGAHGTGKYSLLRLLKGNLIAQKGQVAVPSHLRCICVPRIPQILHNGTLIENLTFGSDQEFDRARLLKLCDLVGVSQYFVKHFESLLQGEEADAEEYTVPGSNKDGAESKVPWYEQLSTSELHKIHLIRALYNDPGILLLQRPVDEMEGPDAARFLGLLRSFVDNRGIANTQQDKKKARPRTVFFSTGEDRERAEYAADVADVLWHLSLKNGFTVKEGGASIHGRHKSSGNKIVGSWSLRAQELHDQSIRLQSDLDRERFSHAQTKKQVEVYHSKVESAREESDQTTDLLVRVQEELQALEEVEEQNQGGFFGCADRRSSKQRIHNLNIMLAGEGPLSPSRGGVTFEDSEEPGPTWREQGQREQAPSREQRPREAADEAALSPRSPRYSPSVHYVYE